MSGSFESPIDLDIYPRLRFESSFNQNIYKSYHLDPKTGDRYFVKRYREDVEDRARREELGLVLCAAYGAITPGHILIYEKKSPVLIQRVVPYPYRFGDLYRANMDLTISRFPDEPARAKMLEGMSTRQVTEIFVCWIADYLTYNWDAHPDNFLLDKLGGSLVGIDKGRTAHWIGHPHLLLDSPSVEGNLVRYVARVSKPVNNVMGHLYEPVWTNVYRKVYRPDLDRISTVLDTVENLDDRYDYYIRMVLDGSGLEAFVKRRETLRQAVAKLFSILRLET